MAIIVTRIDKNYKSKRYISVRNWSSISITPLYSVTTRKTKIKVYSKKCSIVFFIVSEIEQNILKKKTLKKITVFPIYSLEISEELKRGIYWTKYWIDNREKPFEL